MAFYFIFFLSLRDLERGHWSRLNCQLLRCCTFKTTEFECLGPFRVQRWSLRTANVYWHNFFFGSAASAAKTFKQFTKKTPKKTTTKSSTPRHARRHRPVRVKTNKMQSCRTFQLLKKRRKKRTWKHLTALRLNAVFPWWRKEALFKGNCKLSREKKMLHHQKQKAKQRVAKYGVFVLFHKYTCLQPNYGKNTKKGYIVVPVVL